VGVATNGNMVNVHCWLETKGCNTHSEYVIINCFSATTRLHEHTAQSRYTLITRCTIHYNTAVSVPDYRNVQITQF
jgi:hypothetical protein